MPHWWRHAPLSAAEDATPARSPTLASIRRALVLHLTLEALHCAVLATLTAGLLFALPVAIYLHARGAEAASCRVHEICEVHIQLASEPRSPFDRELFGRFVRVRTNGLTTDAADAAAEFMVRGFYDGNGLFIIRFSPDAPGEWKYATQGDLPAFERFGTLVVGPALPGERGAARAEGNGGRFFRFSDGSPYHSFGTTAYAWAHQRQELREATLVARPVSRVARACCQGACTP